MLETSLPMGGMAMQASIEALKGAGAEACLAKKNGNSKCCPEQGSHGTSPQMFS